MTEKQRWLLKDLNDWAERQLARQGRYGPKRKPRPPAIVTSARRAILRAQRIVSDWEASSQVPWKRACQRIQDRREAVRRIILFENTAAALKAIKGLPK